jgi:hypothetical protein
MNQASKKPSQKTSLTRQKRTPRPGTDFSRKRLYALDKRPTLVFIISNLQNLS